MRWTTAKLSGKKFLTADIMRIGSFEIQVALMWVALTLKALTKVNVLVSYLVVNVVRLHLAKYCKVGGNVLLLDEPTNDLDVETLRALKTPC